MSDQTDIDNKADIQEQGHHYHGHSHSHTHGAIDPTILTTERGNWTIKWSFAGLFAAAILQVIVVMFSGSVALLADGYHARVDGWTSLTVLLGVVGVWLGYPLADPIIGLLISIAILRIVWNSGKSVFTRRLDGVNPEVVDEIKHTSSHVQGVREIGEVRVRWLGHRLHAELNIAVSPGLSVEEGHNIASHVRHELLHRLRYLSNATIHIDPSNASGEMHHKIAEHTHDGLPIHSH